jgi:hypothetical protein
MPDFIIVNEAGHQVAEFDDLFDALAYLKKKRPGFKLLRTTDRKVLAYNSTAKIDDDPL